MYFCWNFRHQKDWVHKMWGIVKYVLTLQSFVKTWEFYETFRLGAQAINEMNTHDEKV
jgi:hypothetical protein